MPNSPNSIFEPVYNLPSKYKLPPRKLNFILWILILWVVLLTDEERIGIINDLRTFYIPFKLQLTLPLNFKIIIAFFLAAIANISLDFYIKSYLGIFKKQDDPAKTKELLDNITDKAGIKQIYPGKRGTAAIYQLYSSDMMKSMGNSQTIKLLSIAGHEYIGKGEGASLFYDVIRERHWINIEIILLSPDSADTINERISQLKQKDSSYTSERLKQEILETTNKVKILTSTRNNDNSIHLYYCKFHPIFRLVIFEDCLFMNTYEMDYHGHESPVYKIDKVPSDNITHRLSLYNSFCNLFEHIKKHSTQVV